VRNVAPQTSEFIDPKLWPSSYPAMIELPDISRVSANGIDAPLTINWPEWGNPSAIPASCFAEISIPRLYRCGNPRSWTKRQ
jgi:hypothetical protein